MRAARWLLGVAAALALGGCATTDKNGDLFGEGSWLFDTRTEPEEERLVAVPGTAAAAVELPEQEGGYYDMAEQLSASDRVLRPRGLDGVPLQGAPGGGEGDAGYSVIVMPGSPSLGGAGVNPFVGAQLGTQGFLRGSPTRRDEPDLIHEPGEVSPALPGTQGGAGIPPPGTGPAGL